MNKKVCLFGIFDPAASLNQVLIKGFERNGFEVTECRVPSHAFGKFQKYWLLYRKGRALRSERFDYVVVGFPGHTVVWLARLIFGKHVIFDAVHSLYDANVVDRKLFSKWSPRALWNWFLDWHSMHLAGTVLLHTKGTLSYAVHAFGIPEKKCHVLYTGTDDSVFKSAPHAEETGNELYVHFHAIFTPVQGAEHIVKAAAFLKSEGIRIHMVGGGKRFFERVVAEAERMQLSPAVMVFEGQKPYSEMPLWISKADLCLGIFGDTQKAKTMSVPTKIFEYIAMGKAVVTSDTPAIREVFTDGTDIILSRPGDPKDLAEKIKLLRDDPELRNRIGENARNSFLSRFTYQALIRDLIPKLPLRHAR